jgi:hypothetical protein
MVVYALSVPSGLMEPQYVVLVLLRVHLLFGLLLVGMRAVIVLLL